MASCLTLLLSLLVVGLLLAVCPVCCFNLEPNSATTFNYPEADTQGRQSYFGFAVALHKRDGDNSAWLVVGAPRANSSQYRPNQITEPGAVFKCSLYSRECEELLIDQTGNNINYQIHDYAYQDLKNHGWLGGALDSQPYEDGGRQTTAVCAPRWTNQYYRTNMKYLMNGVCYWLNASLPNAPAEKRMPLVSHSKQSMKVNGVDVYYYSHGQVGFSVHYPDNPTEMILGAPGVLNWRGTVVRFSDNSDHIGGTIARRRRRQVQHRENMFASDLVPNPLYTNIIHDFDLFGYAVTSGRYLAQDQILYAGGAPRGGSSFGKVIIFSFPDQEYEPLKVVQEWQGEQLGANFGAALTSGDINGDGLSDLIVGEPMYFMNDLPDVGRVRVMLSSRDQQLHMSTTALHGNQVSFARFGTTLAAIGDLNADGYEDFAVGAPFEGDGAVYIFLGSIGEPKATHSQRLSPEHFSGGLRGFGMALSRGIDLDNNDYPDLAIGSFLSGNATVIWSRPVARMTGTITTTPSAVTLDATSFEMKACIHYTGKGVPGQITIRGNVSADLQVSRIQFSDTKNNQKEFSQELRLNTANCVEYFLDVKDVTTNRDPIVLQFTYELTEEPRLPLIRRPVLDPDAASGLTSLVSIVTGCEDDGDDVCRTDMRMDASFLDYGQDQRLVIGEDNKPVLRVSVYNTGEPAFQPNLTIQVAPPLSLIMPPSRDCSFSMQGERTTLVCHLDNPITKDGEDIVEVAVDASQLSDRSNQLNVNVTVAAEGEEVEPLNNIMGQALQLQAQASISLHGYSNEEQIRYSLDEKGKVNSTTNPRVLHAFSLIKSGPTPLQHVSFAVSIPVSFKKGQNFTKIFAPEASFLGQPVLCQLSGADFATDSHNNLDDSNVVNLAPADGGTSSTPPPPTNKDDGQVGNAGGHDKTGSDASVVVKAADFNCSSGIVQCAQLTCSVLSWPRGTFSANIEIRMEFDLDVLVENMPSTVGGVFKSTATATIFSLNPALHFTGERTASVMVSTQIQPESLRGKGVPWWVILLAVLGGLLLLALVAYGLYKAGFFQRKEQEEMKAHRAHIETNSPSNGAAYAPMVGD